MSVPSSLLSALGGLTEEAGRIAQAARASLRREIKPDGSIVTNGDRETERFLRDQLPKLAPGATIWGEEEGHQSPGPGGQWLVDPIDGTSNYAYGSPLWGVTIGLYKDGDLRVGAVVLPDLGETYLAERGEGAWRNGARMQPIPPGPIRDEELVSYGDGIARSYPASALPGRMRLSGAFVIDGTFVATQRFRAMIAKGERLYDVAGSVLLVQELGGEVRYADGSPFELAPLTAKVPIGRPWLLFPAGTEFRL